MWVVKKNTLDIPYKKIIQSTFGVRKQSSMHQKNEMKMYMMNSLTKKIEPLPDRDILKWYSCGPTVYNSAHLGHARTYVSQDILYRVLSDYYGKSVYYVMGVTDIDDKIIKAAKEGNKSSKEIARQYESEFFRDMKSLNVQQPSTIVRVSDYMPEIISYISGIMQNGYAYISPTGSGVYFDTMAFGKQYGKLSNQLESSDSSYQSPDLVESSKKNVRDFALWKLIDNLNEPTWDSPWGKGRPGWHIECSAMTHHVFGSTLDLHTGGVDLCFPHHNNEIAQCEAFNQSKEWCSHFVHFGHLYIKGLKMSKSLKNFITIEELLKEYTSDEFRMFCLQHRYRSNLHYSEDRMMEARAHIQRMERFLNQLNSHIRYQDTSQRLHHQDNHLLNQLFQYHTDIRNALAMDLDTPSVCKILDEIISLSNTWIDQCNRQTRIPPVLVLSSIRKLFTNHLQLLGLDEIIQRCSITSTSIDSQPYSQDITELVEDIVQFRASVRNQGLKKDDCSFQELLRSCDEIRKKALSHGIQIQDVGPMRSTWKFADKMEHASTEMNTQVIEKIPRNKLNNQIIPPCDLFRCSEIYNGLFTAYDEKGFPTHNHEGQLLSNSLIKKLRKKYEKYNKQFLNRSTT